MAMDNRLLPFRGEYNSSDLSRMRPDLADLFRRLRFPNL